MIDPGPMGERTHRFEALDSLRGVAALTVALFHFNTTRGIVTNSTFVHHGFLLVDFFFVLSGFVIRAAYGARLEQGFSVPAFLALRLGRLYPLHLAVLLFLVAIEVAHWLGHAPGAFTGERGPAALLACLFLVQPLVGNWGLPWNGPSWSIAVEFWTYAIFAGASRLLGRFMLPAAALTAACSLLWLASWSTSGLNLLHAGTLQRCLYGFGLGVVAHAVHCRIRARAVSAIAATALEIAASAVAVAIVIRAGPTPLSFAAPPAFVAVVLVFAREQGAISAFLRRPLAMRLGALSYSIYMIHQPLWHRLLNLFRFIDLRTGGRFHLIEPGTGYFLGGGALRADALALGGLGLVALAAHVMWTYVEKPGQAWSRRLVLGRRPSVKLMNDEREAAQTF